MKIANKKRFFIFVAAVVAGIALLCFGLWFFRTQPLIDIISKQVNVDDVARMEIMRAQSAFDQEEKAIADPSMIRLVLSTLDSAQVKRKLFIGSAPTIIPDASYKVRIIDAQEKTIVLDIIGARVVVNYSTRYDAVNAEFSSIGQVF